MEDEMKPQYGVSALAKALYEHPKIVRKKLRGAGVKKAGRYYDFKTAKGIEEQKVKLQH
jgi:hypothetical protein